MVKHTRRKRRGGKSGRLTRYLYLNNSDIIGAGGYGIAIRSKGEIFKLLYDTASCKELKKEANIHRKLYTLFPHLVPAITFYSENPIIYKESSYLCGIGMTYLSPPLDFDEAVHMLLGYVGDDIDTSWGRTITQPVSPNNPTRGFFASSETMEWIWKQEGSQMNLDTLASIMGDTYRVMLENGILPIDIEWIWSKGRPWMIDFGLCEEGRVDPATFLETRGVRGLADDFYIPHPGQKGYEAFYRSFLQRDNG